MGYPELSGQVFEAVTEKDYQGFDVADLHEDAYLVMYNFDMNFSIKIPVNVFFE